jgi:alpha-D-ribose 1-methylphosphonate 5-triphosphate synthase subunit PhnG
VKLGRERRCELLAASAPAQLVALADRCLEDGSFSLDLRSGPAIGTVALEVREPVLGQRFILGDVLVTSAEVEWRGKRGWATLLGRDRAAALAAAVCDAEVEAEGPLSAAVERLCADTEVALRAAAQEEESELAETVVRFEELL